MEPGTSEMAVLESRLDSLVREGQSLLGEVGGMLDLPLEVAAPELELDPALLLPSEVDDDRDDLQQGDRSVLVIEDDPDFARIVLDTARGRGFKGVVALRGDAGLALAHEFRPDAIVLDMNLPVMDGWNVLDHLKHHPATRHIVSAASSTGRRTPCAPARRVPQKPLEKEHLFATFEQISTFHRAAGGASGGRGRRRPAQRDRRARGVG